MQEARSSAAPTPAGDRELARVRRRVHERAELVRHLVVFVGVGSGLALVDLLTTPGTVWFIWPMAAWLIGLALDYADVVLGVEGAELEQRIVRREMERHGHGTGLSRAATRARARGSRMNGGPRAGPGQGTVDRRA